MAKMHAVQLARFRELRVIVTQTTARNGIVLAAHEGQPGTPSASTCLAWFLRLTISSS